MNSWYEIWADNGLEVPYILMVQSTKDAILIVDPQEGGQPVFRSKTYEEAKLWLLEDEYVRVSGRMEPED